MIDRFCVKTIIAKRADFGNLISDIKMTEDAWLLVTFMGYLTLGNRMIQWIRDRKSFNRNLFEKEMCANGK
ncbi:hypothetical protein [Parablautia muri]|uniref:Uncharacterized protein n=1 Tax=Parablautia muri TaxID=2320879 RepID=A0A9X5BGD8_9FIRM|nr:hypothetical protein [Parablautia muri]NBJ93193.1 hypothetical protein [Parablautia muri]